MLACKYCIYKILISNILAKQDAPRSNLRTQAQKKQCHTFLRQVKHKQTKKTPKILKPKKQM